MLVLACDLPLVPVELLEALAYTPPDVDWALPYSRREDGLHPEPLCARYGSKTLEALAARVAREELALHPLAEDSRLHIRRIEPDELSSWGQPERLLLNVNRPQDFEVLEEFLRSG